MTLENGATFRDGLVAAVPVVLGYLPIAFSFGVVATQAGLTAVEATALSLIIYAGASQFVAVALVTSGAPILVTAFTLIAMNVRHVLYGPAILKRAGDRATTQHAWAWAWGLTDEVFGQALGSLSRGAGFSERFMFGLGLPAYAAWVGATALGAAFGGGALAGYPAVQAGLAFMLPALFLALLLSILSRRQVPVVVVAAAATVIGTLALSPTVGILAGMFCGVATGILRRSA